MKDEIIDYGDSTLRSIMTWLVYPVCVFIPMGLAIWLFDETRPMATLPFVFFSFFSCGIIERFHPHYQKWLKSDGDVFTDILHVFLSTLLSQGLYFAATLLFFRLITATSGDFSLEVWPHQWPLVWQWVLGLIIVEFSSYWHHRLFHIYHYFWRFHSVHHSSKRLYFLNAPRFQIVDLATSSIMTASLMAVLGASEAVVMLVGVFTGLHGNWQHANIRHKLGWLNWIISGAELHRWHHSSIIRHSNSNYGSNLIIWDVVFGTRCLPKEQQNLQRLGIGKFKKHYPQTWLAQQLIPFRWNAVLKPKATEQAKDSCGDNAAA